MERVFQLTPGNFYYIFNDGRKYNGIMVEEIYAHELVFIGMKLKGPEGMISILFMNPRVYRKTDAGNKIMYRILNTILPNEQAQALSNYL
jgi:hypothetical protein